MTFETIEKELKPILESYEETRADDMALYETYIKRKGLVLARIFSDRSYRIMHSIPPYESISRIRRKIQAKFPELKPSKEYIKERKRAEKEYKNYAKTLYQL